jgi:hypothetical protein
LTEEELTTLTDFDQQDVGANGSGDRTESLGFDVARVLRAVVNLFAKAYQMAWPLRRQRKSR